MTARPDSAAHLRRILDHAPVGIVVTDAEGLVVTWSRHAAEIFGCEEAAALDRPLASLFPGPARRQVRSLLAGGADQAPAPRLLERRSPGGTPQLLELTAVPLTAEEGGPGTLVLVQDATERFRHLHQHRQAEDLLATRARQQAAVAVLGQRALAESDLQALFTEASRLVSE
ncbi:MAG TPA: PAS domain-containing protein, partial [Dehalococcoidia bacterium]